MVNAGDTLYLDRTYPVEGRTPLGSLPWVVPSCWKYILIRYTVCLVYVAYHCITGSQLLNDVNVCYEYIDGPPVTLDSIAFSE